MYKRRRAEIELSNTGDRNIMTVLEEKEEAELSDVDFKFKIFSSQSQDYVQVRHFSALNQGC